MVDEVMARLIVTLSLLLVTISTFAQDWQYQFQDRPSPDANVVVVFHNVRPGSGVDWYVSGRVFNRGLKAAKNVRVIYEVRRSGMVMYTGAVPTTPEDIPPTSFADFDGRIPIYFDPRDHTVQVRAEWSRE